MSAEATEADLAEARRLGDLALDYWLLRDARVQRVSQELRVAAAPLCGDEQNAVLGLSLVSHADVPQPHRAAAERRYPDGRLRVASVFAGMAAARAGILPGDVVLAIDGVRVWSDYNALLEGRGDGDTVRLDLERDGLRLRVAIARLRGCAYPAKLLLRDTIDAGALLELSYTIYYSALVRELRDDAHLAFVIGHEIAHNIVRRLRLVVPRSSEQNEAFADYVGVYLAARAGYVVGGDAGLLFSIFVRGDANTLEVANGTHPLSAARVLAMRRALDEIEEKRARGEELLPEVR
jgi:hypothetical protein